MPSWLNWEISDDEGTNPLGQPGEFEFNVEYDFDPGDPGYMYDRNGDGYPGYPPTVTITGAVCKSVCVGEEKERQPTKEEETALSEWFWVVLDKRPEIRDQMEEHGREQMTFEPDCDDWYD
ncbi:MAG: hypothetical protein EBZ69_00365 [Alphaproteobacteria bacterium]|nr:hypothetical protein [Alphaproteobacteria bacterium]